MSEKEILAELEKMSNEERLRVIETATRLLYDDLQRSSAPRSRKQIREQMRAAAEMMREEYAAGGDLTALTALDSEDFYDA